MAIADNVVPGIACWPHEAGQGHRFTGVRGHCEGGHLAGGPGGVKLDSFGRARQSAGMTDILPGPDCTTMAEVRAGVDRVDADLIALLARRFGYMDAAARIKPERGQVRDEARKAAVIANARAMAAAQGLPSEAIAELWDALVEASIAYELEVFDRR